MTNVAARTTADVVLLAAGLSAAYVIVTTPPLGRLALRTVYAWLGASVPMYILNEVRRAWVESGQPA